MVTGHYYTIFILSRAYVLICDNFQISEFHGQLGCSLPTRRLVLRNEEYYIKIRTLFESWLQKLLTRPEFRHSKLLVDFIRNDERYKKEFFLKISKILLAHHLAQIWSNPPSAWIVLASQLTKLYRINARLGWWRNYHNLHRCIIRRYFPLKHSL